MFRVAVLLSLAGVLLAALALISCLSVEDDSQIRGLPRWLWVPVILLVPLAGPIAWFLAGRPQPAGGHGSVWPLGGGFPEPPRPKAPDDDSDFLRSLDVDGPTVTDQDEELLRRWEEDLRRREEEQRRGRDADSES